MTPVEQRRLKRLVERIAAHDEVPKDTEAVSALAQLLRRRPDAAYGLLLHCLRLEAALEAQQASGAPATQSDDAGHLPGALAAAAPAEPQLRDLLGEFTNTSLLGDLSDLAHPKPAVRTAPDAERPGRADAPAPSPSPRGTAGGGGRY